MVSSGGGSSNKQCKIKRKIKRKCIISLEQSINMLELSGHKLILKSRIMMLKMENIRTQLGILKARLQNEQNQELLRDIKNNLQ
jgi:hypothetical protein